MRLYSTVTREVGPEVQVPLGTTVIVEASGTTCGLTPLASPSSGMRLRQSVPPLAKQG